MAVLYIYIILLYISYIVPSCFVLSLFVNAQISMN